MPLSTMKTLLSTLVSATAVAGHGFVTNIVINGGSYEGYDVTKIPYELPYLKEPPTLVAWSNTALDTGYVGPQNYTHPDIVCHRDGGNALGHARVAAGDKIYIQWNGWPDGHHGPVLDYLAPCGDAGCEKVDKMELEFFKIDEVGLVTPSAQGTYVPGVYGADELIANSHGWLVQVPEDIKPGFYVLRHEIIALHAANQANGAQNYPQCFNLEISGSGTKVPPGLKGTELYTPTDSGILFNIYSDVASYPIPGPTVIAGASSVQQTSSAVVSSISAFTGNTLATNTDQPTSTLAIPVMSTGNSVALPNTSQSVAPSSTAPSTAKPSKATYGGCKAKFPTNKSRRHARDLKV